MLQCVRLVMGSPVLGELGPGQLGPRTVGPRGPTVQGTYHTALFLGKIMMSIMNTLILEAVQ